MSVLDSIKQALGNDDAQDDSQVQYHCDFCDSDFQTAYTFCPDCGSERIHETN